MTATTLIVIIILFWSINSLVFLALIHRNASTWSLRNPFILLWIIGTLAMMIVVKRYVL